MDRAATGIRGLDDLLGGGILRGTWTLLYGENGTGKTVFGMQFVWHGLCQGEVCLYELTDQPAETQRAYFRSFGWDLSAFEKTGQLRFQQSFPRYNLSPDPSVFYVSSRPSAQGTRLFHEGMLAPVNGQRLTRIVADCESLTLMRGGFDEEMRALEWSKEWGMKHGITGVRCVGRDLQDPQAEAMLRQYHDNIIELRLGDTGRELRIVKMFATEHPVDWMPFEITREGVQLKRKHIQPMGYAQSR